jgi:hypothetical protein
VEVKSELGVRSRNLVIVAIICQLMSVHASAGYLDPTSKAIVVVALVISHSFNIILAHLGGIVNHREVNWLGGSHGCTVRYKEEVEGILVLLFYKSRV